MKVLLGRQNYDGPDDFEWESATRLRYSIRLCGAPMAVRVIASAGLSPRSDFGAKSDPVCPLQFMTAPLAARLSRTASIIIRFVCRLVRSSDELRRGQADQGKRDCCDSLRYAPYSRSICSSRTARSSSLSSELTQAVKVRGTPPDTRKTIHRATGRSTACNARNRAGTGPAVDSVRSRRFVDRRNAMTRLQESETTVLASVTAA